MQCSSPWSIRHVVPNVVVVPDSSIEFALSEGSTFPSSTILEIRIYFGLDRRPRCVVQWVDMSIGRQMEREREDEEVRGG